MRYLIIAISSFLLSSGCVRHIYEYEQKKRDYKYPVPVPTATVTDEGSLYSDSNWFSDNRANRLGDQVTVLVEERADARRQATTDLSRNSEVEAGIQSFFGVMEMLRRAGANPTNGDLINPASLINANFSNDFSGAGKSTRTEFMTATVPAVVTKVYPNQSMFVEGHRVVLVDEEEHHFYISGVIRPQDIKPDNSVSSYLLADAHVEFTGRGIISEKQKPGLLSRFLDWIWPF